MHMGAKGNLRIYETHSGPQHSLQFHKLAT